MGQSPVKSISHRATVKRAAAGVKALQRNYNPQTGVYRTTGWWNAANATTTLVDFMRVAHTTKYTKVLGQTFVQAQNVSAAGTGAGKSSGFPNFLNNYYDDEGWWALAWIDSYDLTREPRYLSMAQTIFADMAASWDSTCNGGIWWSKDRNYKNAIANELFFSVAAHLATRATAPQGMPSYAEWADREWRWFQDSGMINGDNLVNDGLTIDKATGACRNNGRTVWSYNQGVVLGALAERYQATQEAAFADAAVAIAQATLAHLTTPEGILHDVCEPHCGADGIQFKGIFVRNLRAFQAARPSEADRAFLERNAESVWFKDQAPGHQFGVVWSGPPVELGAGTQSSAVDALVAGVF